MADWADILGQALAGGGAAYSESKYNSIAHDEAVAEEEAMMNLKRSYQIEDNLWKERMADVQWGREVQENEKKREHERGLVEDQRSDQTEYKKWLMQYEDEREDNAPSDYDQKIKSLKGLGASNERILDMFDNDRKSYQTRPQDYINAEENIITGYQGYLSTLRGEERENPMPQEEWAKKEMPRSFSYVYGGKQTGGQGLLGEPESAGLYETVTDLIDKGDKVALESVRESISDDPEKVAQFDNIGRSYLDSKFKNKSKGVDSKRIGAKKSH